MILPNGRPRWYHIPVEALVDSGASDSFLDPSILVRFNLHPLPHPVPISLELIDGNVPATGPITHYLPSQLRVHGIHTEALTFQVTRLGHSQLGHFIMNSSSHTHSHSTWTKLFS